MINLVENWFNKYNLITFIMRLNLGKLVQF
jgi:hypothetical protein